MSTTIEMINFKTNLIPDPTYCFSNRITHELGALLKYVLLKKIGECQNPDGDYQVFVEPATIRKILQAYMQEHNLSSRVA